MEWIIHQNQTATEGFNSGKLFKTEAAKMMEDFYYNQRQTDFTKRKMQTDWGSWEHRKTKNMKLARIMVEGSHSGNKRGLISINCKTKVTYRKEVNSGIQGSKKLKWREKTWILNSYRMEIWDKKTVGTTIRVKEMASRVEGKEREMKNTEHKFWVQSEISMKLLTIIFTLWVNFQF